MNPSQHESSRSVAEIRSFDAFAIGELGIPGIILMENAGRNAAGIILASLKSPTSDRVAVLCGPGNNGGDGFVIARHLANAGVAVTIVLGTPPERYRGDALLNLEIVRRLRLAIIETVADAPKSPPAVAGTAADRAIGEATVIVDALLGTGSTGPPRPPMDSLIRCANERTDARRIAIDIPSGLDADTGVVHEPCFRAATTITLLARKPGFESSAAKSALGEVVVADIGVSLRFARRGALSPTVPRV